MADAALRQTMSAFDPLRTFNGLETMAATAPVAAIRDQWFNEMMNQLSSGPEGASFESSRRGAALRFAVSVGFVALGWWLRQSGETRSHSAATLHAVGWMTIAVFGAVGSGWLISFFVPQRLRIEANGFSIKKAWTKRKQHRWEEIERVWVLYQRFTSTVVGNYAGPKTSITRSFFGYDRSLPGDWGTSPEELASALNDAKEQQSVRFQNDC